MKISFTSAVGGRRIGEVAGLDTDSAERFVDREYAEELDSDDTPDTDPRPHRGRPPKTPAAVDGE